MQSDNVYKLLQRHHDHKRKGIKHEPLHTLKECYEEAGITHQKYSSFTRKYSGAPVPRFITPPKGGTSRPTEHHVKKDVLAYIEQCRKAEGETR